MRSQGEFAMRGNNGASSTDTWSSTQAYTLAVICLLAGVAGGWLFRGSQPGAGAVPVASSSASLPPAVSANGQPTPEQMKNMADVSAAPLLEKLSSDPNNSGLLADIGNLYYDVQQYPEAIAY